MKTFIINDMVVFRISPNRRGFILKIILHKKSEYSHRDTIGSLVNGQRSVVAYYDDYIWNFRVETICSSEILTVKEHKYDSDINCLRTSTIKNVTASWQYDVWRESTMFTVPNINAMMTFRGRTLSRLRLTYARKLRTALGQRVRDQAAFFQGVH